MTSIPVDQEEEVAAVTSKSSPDIMMNAQVYVGEKPLKKSKGQKKREKRKAKKLAQNFESVKQLVQKQK